MYYGMPQNYGVFPPAHPQKTGHPYHGHYENPMEQQLRNEQPVPEKHGHTHAHSGATTCQDGHTHLHPGVTSTPIRTAEGHMHKIWGNTTFDDEHIHYYEDYTGPPIPLPNGYHTHYAEIRTTEHNGHIHVIKGFTAPSKN